MTGTPIYNLKSRTQAKVAFNSGITTSIFSQSVSDICWNLTAWFRNKKMPMNRNAEYKMSKKQIRS